MDEKNGVEVPQENAPPEENLQQDEELTPDQQASQEEQSAGEPDASSEEAAADSDSSAEAMDEDSPPDADAGANMDAGEESPEDMNGAEMTPEEKAALLSQDDDAGSASDDSGADENLSENADESQGGGLLSQEDIDKAILDSGGEVDPQEESMSQDDINAAINAATDGLDAADFTDEDQPSVKQADFQQLSSSAHGDGPRNIELLMDVDLPVSIELGRTKMNISDILSLGPGSVVELEKLVGEPVDLLVNQRCVARGEVVVVEENFGLRITQLVSPEERIKNLQ